MYIAPLFRSSELGLVCDRCSYKHSAPALKRMSMHDTPTTFCRRGEQSMKPKDWPAVGLGRFGQLFDADFQAEHLQAANEIFALQLDVLAIKVITAEFGVSLIAL